MNIRELCLSRVTITEYHRLGGLNKQMLSCLLLEAKVQVLECQEGWASGKSHPPGCRQAICLFYHIIERERSSRLSDFSKSTNPGTQKPPTLLASSSYLPKTPPAMTITMEGSSSILKTHSVHSKLTLMI